MPMFPRFARSFMRHGVALTRPPQSPQLDDAGDIAMIIGKRGGAFPRRTPVRPSRRLGCATTARSAIWVRHAKFNVRQGKNCNGSGAMVPWLMPFTDAAQIVDVTLEARVNGDLRQSDRTGPMLFPVTRQIAHGSPFTTSVPGDIIATATPVAAGARFDPAVWLQPGDVAEMSLPGIGALCNGVVTA